ncbi:SusC/RagA family TonB-linked outer membrane protein [Larkinella harenae]
MKKTVQAVLLWLLIGWHCESGFAQLLASTPRTTVQLPGKPVMKNLKDVLADYKNHYRVDILYFDHLVEGHVIASDEVTYENRIERSLEHLLKPFGLGYRKTRNGGYVVIQKVEVPKSGRSQGLYDNGSFHETLKARHLNSSPFVPSLKLPDNNRIDRAIKGKVSDQNGGSLPGVNVVVKGTSTGTVTDGNGNYSLTVPDNALLVFSFIGYVSREIAVANVQSTLNITLTADVQTLSEVVVTGYSTERKKDITGSVAIVDTKSLKSIPAGSAVQALQGQAAGVNVISSGSPGAGSNVFIRGISSFGNTRPLVIVDGIQAELNDISADDIESMQVLKDAGAAAIYGVRGSNGVIIVTTKKGKSGQPTFTYETYYGVQQPLPGNPFDLLSSQEYARLSKQVNPNSVLFANGLPDFLYNGPAGSGVARAGDPAVDPSRYNLDLTNPTRNYLIQEVNKTGTDWFHAIFKPAAMTNHNLTASGGTEKSSYLFTLGYFNQQGTLIETYLKRYSARINTEYKLRPNIRVGENAYVFYKQNPQINNQNTFNAISGAMVMLPIIPVRDIRGNYGGTWAGPELGSWGNPVAAQENTRNNRNNTWSVVGNVYAEVDLFKHLTARTSFGGNFTNGYYHTFTPTPYFNREGYSNPNSFSENAWYESNSMWTNILTYKNQFAKHSLSVLAGSEAIRRYGRALGGSRTGFFATNYDYLVLTNGTGTITNTSGAYENTLFSLFGRLDYSYDGKYLLGATVRRDGSSKFGKESRYGVFPSVSLGWRISQEAFMKQISWVSDVKIRASYGVLGSEANVDPSNAYTLFGQDLKKSYYDIAGTSNSAQQGFYQIVNGNSRTGWERNKITNIGLDVSLFRSRLDFSVEYYKKAVDGLLFHQPVPATTGEANPPVINIGDIQNTGFDIAAGYRGRFGNGLQYNANANVTTYKNEVMSIPAPGYFDASYHVRNQVGMPVSSFFGYEVMGLFNSADEVAAAPTQEGAAPGRFRYRDVDGDGAITPNDRTFFGNPNPKFTYGLNLGLEFRGFDLAANFYGSQGNDVLNATRMTTDFFSTTVNNKSNRLLNAWTPENTNTTIPKLESQPSFSTTTVVNSYILEDGSYLRLRSLILGYTLSPALLKRIGLTKLRVYTQAANLFTITNYTGLDPELMGSSAAFGVDYGNYPNNQRNFILGLNLAF